MNQEEIIEEIVSFFISFCTSESYSRLRVEGVDSSPILESKAIWLENCFQEDEINNVVFDMNWYGRSRWFGISKAFIQDCWESLRV